MEGMAGLETLALTASASPPLSIPQLSQRCRRLASLLRLRLGPVSHEMLT